MTEMMRFTIDVPVTEDDAVSTEETAALITGAARAGVLTSVDVALVRNDGEELVYVGKLVSAQVVQA